MHHHHHHHNNNTSHSERDDVTDDDDEITPLDVDEISDDSPPGLYPMTRYGKMSDLSDAGNVLPDNIKDILDQTLETIAE